MLRKLLRRRFGHTSHSHSAESVRTVGSRETAGETEGNERANGLKAIAVDAQVLDLRRLFVIWLKWSWLVLLLAAFGAYQGVGKVRNSAPLYKASMIVQPEAGSSGLSGEAVQLGQALGIGVGNGRLGAATAFGRLQIIVGSVSLSDELQAKQGMLQKVFAGSWDAQTETWIRPDGEDFVRQQRFRSFFGLSPWSPPDVETLASYLGGGIEFKPLETPGFFEVSFSHPDRQMALDILSTVYAEADNRTRLQDLAESIQRRAYIEKQLSSARLVDSRQALVSILTSEEREAMLLESDLPYAARIVEPPFVSSKPEEPNVWFIIIVQMLVWAGGALLLVTLVALFRSPS